MKSMSWTEPTIVRKTYGSYPLLPAWSHFVFVGVFLVFILITLLIRTEDPPIEKIMMIGLGTFLAAACGYGIPLIDGLGGSAISVSAAGIERMDSHLGYNIPILLLFRYRCRKWRWKDISFLYLHTEELKGRSIRILEIVDSNEESLGVIGLPYKKFKMDKLLAVLEENNCPLNGLDDDLDAIAQE